MPGAGGGEPRRLRAAGAGRGRGGAAPPCEARRGGRGRGGRGVDRRNGFDRGIEFRPRDRNHGRGPAAGQNGGRGGE